MSRIHFLNVKEGDCSIIQHNSSRVTVIDVCNAESTETPWQDAMAKMSAGRSGGSGIPGNFRQKEHPVNPVTYLKEHGISSIFRYIQTHPDMDHMDGVRSLFAEFSPVNFWDTDNDKEIESWSGSPYDSSDWEFYKLLRDTDRLRDLTKRLTLSAGRTGEYWNCLGGDNLDILAPTRELVSQANESEDYNDCSYVLLHQDGGKRIIFGGDSHDNTWDHILNNYENSVRNIDLLIAPHHGRDSGRSYEFLDVLNPKLTFFGNARSEYLAYDAWRNRGLTYITNNQANCMVVDIDEILGTMRLYVTNESFARACNPHTIYDPELQAWFVCAI